MNDQFAYNLDAFYEGGPKTWNQAFPPVCVKSHWDPTQISQRVLSSQLIAPLEFDPRQSVKVCTSYYSLSENSPAWDPSAQPAEFQNFQTISKSDEYAQQFDIPDVRNQQTILNGPDYYKRPFDATQMTPIPPGGAAAKGVPFSLYANSINQESDLYRLDKPLTKCKEYRYVPTEGPMDATNTLPEVSQAFGLSPYATYVTETAGCREADDDAAWNRSGRLFFNHTRLDRVYPQSHGPLACGKNS